MDVITIGLDVATQVFQVHGVTTPLALQNGRHGFARVDSGQGQLEFTTEAGVFLLTTPAEMHDFRVGDHLLICLHEEMSAGTERVAEDAPTAIAGAP